jgi:hypothetical protein
LVKSPHFRITMYHTTAIQKRENRGCHTCEANLTCQWVKGIAKTDRAEYICRKYVNRGRDQNGESKQRGR